MFNRRNHKNHGTNAEGESRRESYKTGVYVYANILWITRCNCHTCSVRYAALYFLLWCADIFTTRSTPTSSFHVGWFSKFLALTASGAGVAYGLGYVMAQYTETVIQKETHQIWEVESWGPTATRGGNLSLGLSFGAEVRSSSVV